MSTLRSPKVRKDLMLRSVSSDRRAGNKTLNSSAALQTIESAAGSEIGPIRYRIAYGEAARLIEMSRFDHLWGRDFAARIENQGGKILAEVLRRIWEHDLDVVKEGVEDAMEGSRLKW